MPEPGTPEMGRDPSLEIIAKQKEHCLAVLREIETKLQNLMSSFASGDETSVLMHSSMIRSQLAMRMNGLESVSITPSEKNQVIERFKEIFRDIAEAIASIDLKSELLQVDKDVAKNIQRDVFALPDAISHQIRHVYRGYSGVPDGEEWQLLNDETNDRLVELCAALMHFDPRQEIEALKRDGLSKFTEKISLLQNADKISEELPHPTNPKAEEYVQYVKSAYDSFKRFIEERYGNGRPTEAEAAFALDKVKGYIAELQ